MKKSGRSAAANTAIQIGRTAGLLGVSFDAKDNDVGDTHTDIIAKANREIGVGVLMRLKGNDSIAGVEFVPIGLDSLDKALGGGIPRGRIVEIYGPEAAGKTTLAATILAAYQAQGHDVAIVDAEHAIDPDYMDTIGMRTEDALLSQPDSGEEAFKVVELLASSGKFGAILVDSVAALTPQAELDGDYGDNHVGLQARMMSQAMRKLKGIVNRTDTSIIFINQIRMKIGVKFGSPETTAGGQALKFYASVRMDIRRIGAVKASSADGAEIIGSRVRVKIVKNKVAAPFKSCELDLRYAYGLDAVSDLFDIGVACEVIEKSGSWFSFQGNRLGQGRENVIAHMRENQSIMDEIAEAV